MTVLYLYRLTVNPPQVAKEALANMREPSSSQDYKDLLWDLPVSVQVLHQHQKVN